MYGVCVYQIKFRLTNMQCHVANEQQKQKQIGKAGILCAPQKFVCCAVT